MRRDDIVVVELPPPLGGVGREQAGRRPALVIQDEAANLPTILLAPLTSRLEALRFPFTLRVEPSVTNGLSVPSALLLFQIQVVDKRRIVRTIGQLEPQTVEQVNASLRRMLRLE